MLWGFFDESGEHESADAPAEVRGKLKRLTLAGCWASFENWQQFSLEWAAALEDAGVFMFHMADFEADQGEFAGWRDTKRAYREAFLSRLLDIMDRYVEGYAGVSVGLEPAQSFKSAYHANVEQLFATSRSNGGASLVFARHPEYSPENLALIYEAIALIESGFASCTVADPRVTCPLQAADIVAYELARFQRDKAHQRYPWRRLTERAVSFRWET